MNNRKALERVNNYFISYEHFKELTFSIINVSYLHFICQGKGE